MAAIHPNAPPSPTLTARMGRPSRDSKASLTTFETAEPEIVPPTYREKQDQQEEEEEETDASLVCAIRALRLLENPQAVATEAIQAFDPTASTLHPDLIRLLVAASVRHPDVAQSLLELGTTTTQTGGQLLRRTPSALLQTTTTSANGTARHASGHVHAISISSLLSSISEGSSRRAAEAANANDLVTPTLKRRLSALGMKRTPPEPQSAPRRKEKISTDIVQRICKANLKDTKDSIAKLERAELDNDNNDALKQMAEDGLGHETGKFGLCLALTLRDDKQRWESVKYLMYTMVDKLRMLLAIKGVFGPDGAVGLPGQDGFGIRDCWVVLSEAERERLATEDDGAWPKRLREVAQMAAQQHAARAWEILGACEKIQDTLAPSSPRTSGEEETEERPWSDSSNSGGESKASRLVVTRQAAPAASQEELMDRWAFFFDLLDEEGTRRCFRELRLLRQLFNAAQAPAETTRTGANLRAKTKKAFEAARLDDDMERWLDTKWAISAMKGFMMAKAQELIGDGEVRYESLDRLDNAFCKTFWGCLASGYHKRLAAEEGRQWVTDIMKIFEDRRRHEAMFRLRDIMHFMQNHM